MSFVKKVKQQLAILLAVLLAVVNLSVVPAYAEGLFPDLENHWAKDQCYRMYDYEVFEGYPDGRFGPDDLVTRAQFVALVVRAFDFPAAPADTVLPYEDVKPGDWFYEPIARAYAFGSLNYFTGNKFEPNKPITRGEIACIIDATIHDNCFIVATLEKPFTDVNINTPICKTPMGDAIINVALFGVIKGYPDGRFGPYDTATRAQAAAMLERAIMAEARPEVLPDEATIKTVVEQYADRWAYLCYTYAASRVNEYLGEYATQSVLRWYKNGIIKALDGSSPIPGLYGRLEPNTMQMKILHASRTLVEVEAHYKVGARLRRLADNREAQVAVYQVDEKLLLKLIDGKWKVAVVEDQNQTEIQ